MIVIGPGLHTGIGHHAEKYTKLFPENVYHVFGGEIPVSEHGLVFILPIKEHIEYLKYVRTRVKNVACMTVCETETVHEDYSLIMKEFKRVAVPSEFCKRVFSKQFPDNEFYVIHAHIPQPREKPYTFYHIGNIMDPRKKFKDILQAFVRLNEPNSRLVVKATCGKPVNIQFPRVEVINDMLSDEEMNDLHNRCDCYVNFSHSEGVGMGAVEAALRDKPVIITDYGGAPEYIKTPYKIDCRLQELEKDDFLFKKGMVWGDPNFDQLLEFMRHAYDNRIREMDHRHTKNLVGRENILEEFILNVIGSKNDKTD
jgi:glycosyltransferase involved in cell wall biosynthesis|tara:strand:+ start:343 stop:1278 length:936 start_codon:yes stop_codon:yes gene_type:complete